MRVGMAYLWIAAGFGLRQISRSLELWGDLSAEPADRLTYHGLALIVLIATAACFVRAGWMLLRSSRARKSNHADIARVFADEQPPAFDADAALARFMERKRAEQPQDGTPPPPPPRGTFGRKRG